MSRWIKWQVGCLTACLDCCARDVSDGNSQTLHDPAQQRHYHHHHSSPTHTSPSPQSALFECLTKMSTSNHALLAASPAGSRKNTCVSKHWSRPTGGWTDLLPRPWITDYGLGYYSKVSHSASSSHGPLEFLPHKGPMFGGAAWRSFPPHRLDGVSCAMLQFPFSQAFPCSSIPLGWAGSLANWPG